MPTKVKAKPPVPAKPARAARAPQTLKAATNPLQQADSRWQRTVRYGWDKGGAKGGR